MSKEKILQLRNSQTIVELKNKYNYVCGVFNMNLTIAIMDLFNCSEEESILIIDNSVDNILFC